MPRLLIDTDAFCKLGIAGLLEPATQIFGVRLAECGCLPALPHMLRRGKLPKVFGAEACAKLVPTAEAMSASPLPSTPSLEKLANIDRVDVGEAQIFAAVADLGIVAFTGDKRALNAVAQVPDFHALIAGRIVVLEALLISLCGRMGDDVVRAALSPILDKDRTAAICFSHENGEPRSALRSYFESLKREVVPLVLWEPVEGNA